MYDLEIIVPVELNNEKLKARFIDFKKWGFVNVQNAKVKLWLMAAFDNNIDDVIDLTKGWPANIDVEAMVTPYKHVCQRIFHYYTACMKPDTARWYMRVDEDSMTDITGLLNNLDSWFDYKRDFYIVGEINRDISDIECQLLRSLGYDWWYKIQGHDLRDAPAHEFETSVVSNETIKKILNNPDSMQYLNMRKEFAVDYGDHALCLAARMVKVYPISVRFLTWNPTAIQFSTFGGPINHIHQISRDRYFEFISWLNLIENGTNPELEEELTNNSYFLSWWNNRETLWVTFTKDRRIEITPPRMDHFGKEILGIWGITQEGNLTVFVTNDFKNNNPIIVLEKNSFGFSIVKNSKKFELRFANKVKPKNLPML